MTRLAEEPDVIHLANDLGLGGAGEAVVAILDACRGRIDRWVAESGGVSSVEQLEALVARKLQMVFEEIRDDRDFDRITDVYAKGKRDPIFATMRMEFGDEETPTYGTLVQRRNVPADAPDRYVAVIDCRGEKLARRFFTRWHEIAHRMTTDADPDEPAYRSEHDPIEQLMDRIASHVGFYEPFFDPAYVRAMRGSRRLSFEAVEEVRRSAFLDASFQATLFACHRRHAEPALYVEAAPALKADDRREMQGGRQWLFEELRPVEQLRAVKVIQNESARLTGLFISPNMRVPESSLIHRVFGGQTSMAGVSTENLRDWEHSGGKRLADLEVRVEARRAKDRVIALVQPTSVGV